MSSSPCRWCSPTASPSVLLADISGDPSERVVDVPDLRWSFDDQGPRIEFQAFGGWRQTEKVKAAKAYPHPRDYVVELLRHCEHVFPVTTPPKVFLPHYDNVGGTNGHTSSDDNYDVKDEHGRGKRQNYIVLWGKWIPIHPAMTRYLMAHEYGHVVEDYLGFKRYKSKQPDQELLADYQKMRGSDTPPFYGPGMWHRQTGEIFANDFRILVAGIEPEFWPHDVPHPTRVPEVVKWWNEATIEAAWPLRLAS